MSSLRARRPIGVPSSFRAGDQPTEVRLQDLGSLNGTLVNGIKNARATSARSQREREAKANDLRDTQAWRRHRGRGNADPGRSCAGNASCRLCGAMVRVEGDGGATGLCETCQRGTESTVEPRTSVVNSPLRQVSRGHDARGRSFRVRRLRVSAVPSQTAPQLPGPAVVGSGDSRSRMDRTGKPRQLAGYVLEKVLGKGGMGVVYRARSKEIRVPDHRTEGHPDGLGCGREES